MAKPVIEACPDCGLRLSEIVSRAMTGCPVCWSVFGERLVKRSTGGHLVYRGRQAYRFRLKTKPAEESLRWRIELDQALKTEDYERAAFLRDRIKENPAP